VQQEFLEKCEQAFCNGLGIPDTAMASEEILKAELLGQDLIQNILQRQNSIDDRTLTGRVWRQLDNSPLRNVRLHRDQGGDTLSQVALGIVRAAQAGNLTNRTASMSQTRNRTSVTGVGGKSLEAGKGWDPCENAFGFSSTQTYDIMNQMPRHCRDECIARMRVLTFETGEAIIERGTIGTNMYFLDYGCATAEMEDRVVNTFMPGDLFGEVSFLATVVSLLQGGDFSSSRPLRRTATVRAREWCRCLELAVTDLLEVYGTDRAGLDSMLRVMMESTASRVKMSPATASTPSVSSGQQSPLSELTTDPSEKAARADTLSEAAMAMDSDAGSSSWKEDGKNGMMEELSEGEDEVEKQRLVFMRTYISRKGQPVQKASESTAFNLLDAMSDRSRMECVSRMKLTRYKNGELILRKGTVGKTLCIVCEGAAKANVAHMRDGDIVQELRKGSLFGEIAFLASCVQAFQDVEFRCATEQLRTCDVVASGDSLVWELHVDDFVEVVGSDLRNNWEVIRALAKCSQRRVQRMMQLKSTAETDVTPEPQSPSPLCELKSPVSCTGEQQISLNTIHEIIPRKLSFILFENDAIMKKSIMEQREVYFFSSDYHEAYVPFFEDFGPVDLGLVVQFCRLIEAKTSHPRLGNRTATYYAESDGPRRTNAAFLVGAYLIIMHGWTPEEAVHKLQQVCVGLGEGVGRFGERHSGVFVKLMDATWARTQTQRFVSI
jgi:CRP-like cAMP-binding protein